MKSPVSTTSRPVHRPRAAARAVSATVVRIEEFGPELRLELEDAASRIEGIVNLGAEEIGKILQEVKPKLGHGQFGRWVQTRLNMSARTAERYMSVAAHFAGQCDKLSRLPPTVVYQLAARSTPQSARDEVLAALESGERLERVAVTDMIRAAREKVKSQNGEPAPQHEPSSTRKSDTMSFLPGAKRGAEKPTATPSTPSVPKQRRSISLQRRRSSTPNHTNMRMSRSRRWIKPQGFCSITSERLMRSGFSN
jgi:Protein of unknown function (DUF3102)